MTLPAVAVSVAVLSPLQALSPQASHANPPAPTPPGETRISIDVKDAQVSDVVLALAEVGRFQIVFDAAVDCKLTLALKRVRWEQAFATALKSCGLGKDEEGDIVRVAPLAKLAAELREQAAYAERRQANTERQRTAFRLSYARAAEAAPIVQKLLGPRTEVLADARTNTLIIIQ